jgi:hypothetical protein
MHTSLTGDYQCKFQRNSSTRNLVRMTNFLDIIHRLSLIKKHKTFRRLESVSKTSPSSSIYWAQQSRCPIFYLMTETDSSLRNIVCFFYQE